MTVERVIPVLVYRDIAAAHDFLVRAFGFDSGGIERSPDGQAVHGEVRAGNTAIWLHRVTDEHGLDSPKSVEMAAAGLVIHVSDVDAHCAAARAAGAHYIWTDRSAIRATRVRSTRPGRPPLVVCHSARRAADRVRPSGSVRASP